MSSRWLFGCLLLGACSSSSEDPVATRACDPLSVEAPPISLGEIVGAGRAATFPALVPVFALIIGYFALGVGPSLAQLAGMLIVLVGFRFALR